MNYRVTALPLLVLGSFVIAVPPVALAQGTCSLLGEIFMTSPFDQNLTIKGDGSANINTIQFTNQTQFAQVTVERKFAGNFDPKNFHTGDRLCVQLSPSDVKTAARVLVMKRLDIQEHQKQVFSVLASNSAFGIVSDLNAESRMIRLQEQLGDGATRQVFVNAKDPVAFLRYPSDAMTGKDGVMTGWASLRVGDHIYVQGKRDSGLLAIRAGIVVLGGVRGIVGTIVSMSGFGDVIELNELGSRNLLTIQLRRESVFRASPFVEAANVVKQNGDPASWDLAPISFSDLQKGDTVSVLVREGDAQNTALGLMVVTGFGSYGIKALPPGSPPFWFIDPLKGSH